MAVAETKTMLRELGAVSTALTSEQKQQIEQLYELVMDEPFVKTSCNDCYRDACIIAYNYLERHGNYATHRQYKMYIGPCVQLNFGKPEFLTAQTCTDEKARKYLSEHPEDITLFQKYPVNWKEDVKNAAQGNNNTVDVQSTTTKKRSRRTRKNEQVNERTHT